MKRMLMMMLGIAAPLALVLALADSEPARAQSAQQLQEELRKATRVECKFSTLTTADWKDGTPKAVVSSAALEATFFDIDVDGGTAEAEGDLGESYIVVRYSHGYLHLMQMSDAGPLRITTVLAEAAPNGRMKAVQTRHEYTVVRLPGYTSRPEMYIGDCAVS
jgi:hypothetical protein